MSVGGTEGKKRMRGMSEQCRSGMRMDHCCCVRVAPISSLELTKEVKQPKVEGKHIISDLSHQPLIPDDDIAANTLLGVVKI